MLCLALALLGCAGREDRKCKQQHDRHREQRRTDHNGPLDREPEWCDLSPHCRCIGELTKVRNIQLLLW